MIVDPSDTIGSPALELDLRFQHLGIAVNDVDEALPFYRDELVAIAPPQAAWRRRRTILP